MRYAGTGAKQRWRLGRTARLQVALMAQMPSEMATLTSRAELAEAQARRAEKIVQTLKAEIRAWRSSATSEQLDSVKESLASEEALAVTAGSTDEGEVSMLR